MRSIAFVSDIHGNLPALQAVAQDIVRQGVRVVVNLGDALSGPLLARDTAHWLMRHGSTSADATPWLHIAGNHERQLLAAVEQLTQPLQAQDPTDSDHLAALDMDDAALNWVRTLPQPTRPDLLEGRWRADLLGPEVALCHGSPRHDTEYLLDTPEGEHLRLASIEELEERLAQRIPTHITLLACGHSHLPHTLSLPRRGAPALRLLNPGSVGLPAYDDDTPYPASRYHRVENGSPDARYAIASQTTPGSPWTVALRTVPYDPEPMARLAERHGRPDWAYALRTGRMPRHPS
ncbi:metallophosphoesterase family protein [Tepidicella baoligensis]|uniref:metallophosphoesterase family protein n=1 Tax=Tepidicella baoligensis TaxID=2707016 RepID=UPI0015D9FB4A|nr:metallophosphoesterase family protein [Tepidicella baoligensis]